MNSDAESNHNNTRSLTIGALGIVFGDIGTSPLYAVQECFAHGLEATRENILGVISLIFWGLMIIVSLKYIFIVMRANNRGEGGILALTAMAMGGARRQGLGLRIIVLIGLFGAALFFGDSMITPAISVLSAVEGLNIAAPQLQPFILPIAAIILVCLFLFQRLGTKQVGGHFGPVMLVWFLVIGIMGLQSIIARPQILEALNPVHALSLIAAHGLVGSAVLGAVLLAFTGAEALYADMGHFGRKPIRNAWFLVVLPTLLLSYFGQGALLIDQPTAVANPFYLLVPPEFMLSMVGLAALATVIASQSVISGTFSLVQQAMQLDYLPRFNIQHTSEDTAGQIYIPQINWLLCFMVLLLVVLFRSSGALSNAYGFAVAGTMLSTTILVFSVARNVWHWKLWATALLMCPLLAIDSMFFLTATAKIPDGGWLPLIIGIGVFTIFMTWKQGRAVVRNHRRITSRKLESFLIDLAPDHPVRVEGTAIYLSSVRFVVPQALLSNLRHNKVLHDRVIILNVRSEEEPRVPDEQRVTVKHLGKGFWQVVMYYGFMERPDVVNDLQTYLLADCPIDMTETSFFIGHDMFVEGLHPLKPFWREKLFLWLSNHAAAAFQYFRIPTEQVVELGIRIEV